MKQEETLTLLVAERVEITARKLREAVRSILELETKQIYKEIDKEQSKTNHEEFHGM